MMGCTTYESVHRVVGLCVEITALALGILSGVVNETSISRFVGGSQDQRGIGGSVLQFTLIISNGATGTPRGFLYLGFVNIDS